MGQKKSLNLSGQKYRATSQDKKSRNLLRQKIMHYFRTKQITPPLGPKNYALFKKKKNHAISWDKKILRNQLGRKNHATSWDKKKSCNLSEQKKSCNLSGQKKITQPFRTKKYATSWDKKNTQPLGTKQNQATSWEQKSRNLWDKKIMQPLGDKKKSRSQ